MPSKTSTKAPRKPFIQQILQWFEAEGRKNLPWQHQPTPYRVWVSEIMLQQTQVNTVIPFYQRFMSRFPTVKALAHAELDEVLHHWTGLGYYARARNLHKCASIISHKHRGIFPLTLAELIALPGIGKSTAGAILSLSKNIKATLLDGNVKRVLARVHTVEGWPQAASTQKQLWALADHYTPEHAARQYNQAMMDLGATICVRSQPNCLLCPIQKFCKAYKLGLQNRYPHSKPKKEKPTQNCYMLMLTDQKQRVFLEKRPSSGIWGGLWSFPEYQTLKETTAACKNFFQIKRPKLLPWPTLKHSFTHYHLEITPITLSAQSFSQLKASKSHLWYDLHCPPNIGLAAPVKKLLAQLKKENVSL